jgi:hypothetical protein
LDPTIMSGAESVDAEERAKRHEQCPRLRDSAGAGAAELIVFSARAKFGLVKTSRERKRDREKPLKKRGTLLLTVLVVVTAIVGFIAWYKSKQDEFFGLFRDFYHYVILHQSTRLLPWVFNGESHAGPRMKNLRLREELFD